MTRAGTRTAIHGSRLALASVVIANMLVIACGTTPSASIIEGLEERVLAAPAHLYGAVAWVRDDLIALEFLDASPGVVLVDPQGIERASVEFAERPACAVREFVTVARLPTGELGVVDRCEVAFSPSPEPAEFLAVDLETKAIRSLGRAARQPYSIAWNADLTAVYSVGDHLCSTLYRYADGKEDPLDRMVTIEGTQFNAGQDVTAASDGCPVAGRAAHPAYSSDGSSLAFLASLNGSTQPGQDLLEVPWSLFVTTGGAEPTRVLDGIVDPGDMVWGTADRSVIFAGRIAGGVGTWSISPDGQGLARLSGRRPMRLALSPDGTEIVGTIPPEDDSHRSEVFVLTLPSSRVSPPPAST
jgi:hypothetical protein